MKKRRRESRQSLLRRIRTFNDPVLKTHCDETDLKTAKPVFTKMFHVLNATSNGVGLAANQIGSTQRIIVIRPTKAYMTVMINPKIVFKGSSMGTASESCLSYPGIHKNVKRRRLIGLEYMDEIGHLKRKDYEFFPARIIQHEIDHLNGKCALAPAHSR